MIEQTDQCRELLRCPQTGAALIFADDGSAATHDGRYRYSAADGLPVLIDFNRSVVANTPGLFSKRTSGAVARPRYPGPVQWVKRLLSPEKRETRENIAEFLQLVKTAATPARVLVIGGGTVGQGMQALYADPAVRIVAFDLYWSQHAQFIADAHAIPLADACFDGVVIQAVLEHVLEPGRVVAEIWRVLKPGGLVYAETPFLQQVHEGPYDFTRFTESGHRYLFRNFALVKSGPCGGVGVQLLWSIDYFFRSLFRSRLAGKAAKLAFFWLQYFDRIIPASHASDAASGVYFLGSKARHPLSAREVIDFYRGAQRPTPA